MCILSRVTHHLGHLVDHLVAQAVGGLPMKFEYVYLQAREFIERHYGPTLRNCTMKWRYEVGHLVAQAAGGLPILIQICLCACAHICQFV